MPRKPLADMCSNSADLRKMHAHIEEGVSADLKDAAHCGAQYVTVPESWVEGAAQFGKSGDKQATYQAVFNALEQSLANGGQLRGALFWRWNEDGGSDLNTVYTGDSTWQYAPPQKLHVVTTANLLACRFRGSLCNGLVLVHTIADYLVWEVSGP